jgi:PAS domain S-box-containing protein
MRIVERIGNQGETHDGKFLTTDDFINVEADPLFTTSEQYLKEIIAATEQWIWEMDINARYTYVSSTVEKALGYKPQEVIGRTFFEFLLKDDNQQAEAFLCRSKKDKSGFKSFLHRKCHRDRKITWSETTGFPVLNKEGSFRGWRGVEQDVTPRKKIEEKFHHHQQLLDVLNVLNTIQIKTENLDHMLYTIATHLREVFAADKVEIFIPAPDSDGTYFLKEDTRSRIVRQKLLHLTKDGNYNEKIFTIGTTVLPHHFKVWKRSRSLISYTQKEDHRSCMSIPLRSQDGILGVIEFSKMQRDGFSHVDLELMDAIGARMGLIIERSCYCAALQDREKDVNMMSARLVHAQENERHRISRILHDEVGQFLSSANMILKSAELELDSGPKRCKNHIKEVKSLIGKAMRRSRDLSFELGPVVLENIGLIPALKNMVAHYQEVFSVKIDFISAGIDGRFPENVELTLYRVGEEALRNLTTHARAQKVSLKLVQSGNRVFLAVRDDGIGFDYEKERSSGKGLGLKIMEERMSTVGGDLRVVSKQNKGTLVVARLCFGNGKEENGHHRFHR